MIKDLALSLLWYGLTPDPDTSACFRYDQKLNLKIKLYLKKKEN